MRCKAADHSVLTWAALSAPVASIKPYPQGSEHSSAKPWCGCHAHCTNEESVEVGEEGKNRFVFIISAQQ